MKKTTTIIMLIPLALALGLSVTAGQIISNGSNVAVENYNQLQVISSQAIQGTSESINAKNKDFSSSPTVVVEDVVKAYDLFKAYKNDSSRKQATYNGENIIVNGIITYIGRDSHGTPSITLSDKAGGTGYVLCVFGAFDELKTFYLGQEVTVSANFHIMSSDGMVVLKQSKVL